jgi:3-isopropylmalate dehydratase small subunit
MEPFVRLDGRAAPLGLANIDTDQIIPARFLKTVERKGLGRGLFAGLRFDDKGEPRSDFVLNQPAYAGASVLVVGDNFGCGSSREHAPWALMDYGIRCVIAPSFADIFFNNAANNGLLLITLPEAEVETLMDEARGGNHVFSVDLEAQTVTTPSGAVHRFDIDPVRKEKLLKGLDPIGETLQHDRDIGAFEERRRLVEPWLD